jgi:Predicted exosome subunit
MPKIQQPSNQIKWHPFAFMFFKHGPLTISFHRLTNVSIVRLKKGGKRFEVSPFSWTSCRIHIISRLHVIRIKSRSGGPECTLLSWLNKYSATDIYFLSETNLDDVMQVSNVFVNVSKGEVAKSGDLQKAFGTSHLSEIIQEVCHTSSLVLASLSNNWPW